MYICIYLVYIYIQPNNLSFDLFRQPTTSLLLSSQAHGDAHRQHAFGGPGHIAPGSSVPDGLPVGHDFLQLLRHQIVRFSAFFALAEEEKEAS